MEPKTVKAIIDGQEYTLTYNGETKKWTALFTAPSRSSYNEEGHYYDVTARATDEAGNVKEVNSSTEGAIGEALRLEVNEHVKPTATITAPGENALLTDNTPEITVQLRDDDSGINIDTFLLEIDSNPAIGSDSPGVSTESVSGGYDVVYTPQEALGDGAHTIKVNVSDNDGNAADAVTRSIKIDTTPPSLDITNPPDNFVTNQKVITFEGSASDASGAPTVTMLLNEKTDQGEVTLNGEGKFTKQVTLENEGVNYVDTTATDKAGKTTTIRRTIILNTHAPEFKTVTLTPNPVDAGATCQIDITFEDANEEAMNG